MGTGALIVTNTGTPRMTTEAQRLTIAQLFSPAFPIGSFAYSHGLEVAISDGVVSDAASLEGWLCDLLRYGSGWADAVLLVASHGVDDAFAADTAARAFAASAERLHETSTQGAAFCDAVAAAWQLPLADLTYPVAVGQATRLLGLPVQAVTAHYLMAFAANLVSVAVRFVPLGQSDGQRVQLALQPVVLAVAEAAQGTSLDDLSSATFLSDIAAMRHETLPTRTFRT